jgi:hypothetical protein
MSDDLVDRFADGLRPTPKGVVGRRLLIGLAGGGVFSAALAVATLGLRSDLHRVVGEPMFWGKFGYTFALAGLALWACEPLMRPVGSARSRLPWMVGPVLALAAVAGWRLARTPSAGRMEMIMGHTAAICPWLILVLSLPPLLGLIWAARGLAPTRLRLAGLISGLAAGGAGATAYALHCDEMAAPFLTVWYTLGIAGAGLLGWLIGPRVLRW